MTSLEILMSAYRAANPRTRVEGPIKHDNSAKRRGRVCVLCGDTSSCSAQYPPTKKHIAWESGHACWAELEVDAAQVRADQWLEKGGFGKLVP